MDGMKKQKRGDACALMRLFRASFLITFGGAHMRHHTLTFATAFSHTPPPQPPLLRIQVIVSNPVSHLNRQSHQGFIHEGILLSSMMEAASVKTPSSVAQTSTVAEMNPKFINKLEYDEVVRVIDQNTVKLKRNGLVSFAAVQTPSGYASNFQFPACMTKSPSSKVRQLLPPKKIVGVRFIENSKSSSRPRTALIVIDNGTLLVNSELVRSGFAKPISRGRDACEAILPGFTQQLVACQKEAQKNKIGIYTDCNLQNQDDMIASDNQFEPLEYTVETQWGHDGGEQVLRKRKGAANEPPANPGDAKGCSDFEYYEDALRWFETYQPFYGDVAKLDPDRDGVPCPGLRHTPDQSRYRMKVPSR